MKKRLWLIQLILFLVIGLFLRTWQYQNLPYPPNGDELAFGYYGWSILNFTTDEYGNKFPLYFPSIGDYKYPTLVYLNTIPAALFGLSDLTVRFWSFTMGTILILLIFILGVILFNSIVVGLFAAILLALSPWGIALSRYGYETNVATTLTTAAIILLLLNGKTYRQTLSEKLRIPLKLNPIFLLPGAFVLLLLSSFCYGAQRVFIPLILLIFTLVGFVKKSPLDGFKKTLIALFLILTTIIALSLIPWQSRGRASGVLVSSLSTQQQNKLEEAAVEAGTSPVRVPVWITYAFNNKYKTQFLDLASRYSKHFESDFLFFQGAPTVERVPDTGVLLLVQLILLPLGLILLLTFQNKFSAAFLLGWLLISPVASSLTVEGVSLNRAHIMLPPLVLISAFGASKLLDVTKTQRQKYIIAALLFGLIFLNGLYVLNQLFVHKPLRRPWFSETVGRTLVFEIQKFQSNYKAIAIPNNDYIYFLFYQKITPQKFLETAEVLPESRQNQWERVVRLGNIHFKMPYDCPKSGKVNVLYVCKGLNIPQNSKIISVIRYLDGIPAYTLLEFQPFSQVSELPKLPERLDYMVDRETLYPDGIIPDSHPTLW